MSKSAPNTHSNTQFTKRWVAPDRLRYSLRALIYSSTKPLFMRTKQLRTLISTLALFILMISVFVSCEKSQPVEDPQHFDLDVTFHTENLKDQSNKGFGFLKFRQDPDTARIITLDTYIFNLLPNHSYLLQRAANPFSDPTCTNASWLTLGKGLVAQDIATDSKGDGHE